MLPALNLMVENSRKNALSLSRCMCVSSILIDEVSNCVEKESQRLHMCSVRWHSIRSYVGGNLLPLDSVEIGMQHFSPLSIVCLLGSIHEYKHQFLWNYDEFSQTSGNKIIINWTNLRWEPTLNTKKNNLNLIKKIYVIKIGPFQMFVQIERSITLPKIKLELTPDWETHFE